MANSVYVAPVTELTSSEDEGTAQASPPPGKKPRHGGVSHGVSPEFVSAALLDEILPVQQGEIFWRILLSQIPRLVV